MMVSREEFEAARHPKCEWTADMLADAIEARFPGGRPVDLVELIDAWLADAALSTSTLSNCALLAARLAKKSAGRPWLRPRTGLEEIKAALLAPLEAPKK